MKLDIIYAKVDEKWRNGGFFKGIEECHCAICNEPTKWIEPTWDVFICSSECYTDLWKKYKESINDIR
jgi:hypothetical protein